MATNLSELPEGLAAPEDDGGADHLRPGVQMPSIDLPTTDGGTIDFAALLGLSVVYAYPMTGRPDQELPTGWDEIPGARGCTPQACSFRDHLSELKALGVDHVFGLSTQSEDWQREAAERLHLPFQLASDCDLKLTRALNLPVLQVDGMTLTKRLTLILRDGAIEHVFYPVFPPDQSAQEVLVYLRSRAV